MQKKFSLSLITVAMLSIATLVFAESAPVYDADAVQEQFDNANNSNNTQSTHQQDVYPPPPGQEANAFIPVLPSVGAASTSSQPPAQRPTQTAQPGNQNVEKRIKQLEQQLSNSQTGENLARIDSLQQEVQMLRGQLEQMTHQMQQMQDQQKETLSDVDKRLADVAKGKKALAAGISVDGGNAAAATPQTKPAAKGKNTKVASNSPEDLAASAAQAVQATPADDAPKAQASTQPNVAEEQQIYQTAYNLIKAKKYKEAVDALQGMLKKYPSGQFASNAHYWLGELFGLLNKNDDALTEFTVVVSKYPDSPRVADAQLKVGLIYAAESNWSEAKTAFKKVVNHYPGTASARVASEQLKAIKQTGN